MKPPWKFIADLVSRRNASDVQDNSIEPARDEKVLQIASPPVVEAVASEPQVVAEDRAESDVIQSVLEESPAIATSVAEELQNSVAEVGELVAEDASAAEPVKSAGRQARVTATKPVAAVEATPSPVSGDKTDDEALSLDREITNLRVQLAEKLRLQNAQLKKMLDRYERP